MGGTDASDNDGMDEIRVSHDFGERPSEVSSRVRT